MRIKFFTMLFLTLLFISCSSSTPDNNDNLPNIPVNITLSLNSPQYQNLLVPGGWVYASGGIKGLIVYNFNGTEFAAFDRACPHVSVSDACSQMIVESSIKMVCPCDDAEFNILNGAPLTTGITVGARAYRAELVSSSTLTITNF
jgi:nitrite reductase/ring-hydroxylating ferredoxin subunit